MVKIKIMGGLGNQMFQYALYKKFMVKNIKAAVNLEFYNTKTLHNGYELERVFGLKPLVAKKEHKFKNQFIEKVVRKLTCIFEHDFDYDVKIFNYKYKTLIGYWQNENYFKDIRKELLSDFSYKIDDSINLEIQNEMMKSNSVSIHIRRGDYMDTKNLKTHYVIKNSNYYNRAIEYISKAIDYPKFFVFSDDIEWVRNNINIPNPTFIDWNIGKDSFKDMILMSKCKHNIIANSTFSWWGAWLNQNSEKIVIAPEVWLNTIDASNVVCNDWIRIDVN